jgi:hypothetical protein
MPYVCDNSRLDWTDDDEPIAPKPSNFVYMPAKELGGPAGPARLRIPTGSEPYNDDELENPQETRALHLALKASGVAKVYCRYDGGNDEGFAWVDHAELGSGERLDTAALAKRRSPTACPRGIGCNGRKTGQMNAWSGHARLSSRRELGCSAPRRPKLWHGRLTRCTAPLPWIWSQR